jgi:hypothetical protein
LVLFPSANVYDPQRSVTSKPLCKFRSALVNSPSILDNISSTRGPIKISARSPSGAMVQRLAHRPFKAVIRVRFPLALPNLLFALFRIQVVGNNGELT